MTHWNALHHILQHIAATCAATYCNTHSVLAAYAMDTVRCGVVKRTATHAATHTATHCNAHSVLVVYAMDAVRCGVVKRTAAHAATHGCNTLQHTQCASRVRNGCSALWCGVYVECCYAHLWYELRYTCIHIHTYTDTDTDTDTDRDINIDIDTDTDTDTHTHTHCDTHNTSIWGG